MQTGMWEKRGDRARQRYFTTLKYQGAVLALIVLLLVPFDFVVAYSALLGGLIYLVPQLWHAWRHFKNRAPGTANRALAELYAGQIWKMALMAMLFALSFVLIEPLSGFSLFAALLLMQVMNLVMQVSGARNS